MSHAGNDESNFDAVETTSVPVVSPPPPTDIVTDRNPDSAHRIGFLGTGLSAAMLAAILAVSTAAFLFWGGALWRAQPGISHVWRIAGSYLIVVPLAALALAVSRRWSVQHVLGSVAAVWSAKLVITATSYTFVAPGSATEYEPVRPWESRAPTSSIDSSARHRAAPKIAGMGTLAGAILEDGAPGRAVVVVGDFESPYAAASPREIALGIENSRYEKDIYIARTSDRLFVANRDGVLHTIRFVREKSAAANVPVPPGPSRPLAAPPPGAYEMSCENHASERALLVVVDHDLVAESDATGRFEVPGVPAGEHVITVLRPLRQPVRRAVRLAPNEVSELVIDLE